MRYWTYPKEVKVRHMDYSVLRLQSSREGEREVLVWGLFCLVSDRRVASGVQDLTQDLVVIRDGARVRTTRLQSYDDGRLGKSCAQ